MAIGKSIFCLRVVYYIDMSGSANKYMIFMVI